MIVIENVQKKYGKVKVLAGVTFELFPQEILALIGPSGSGKTTLLRVIAGFEKPDGGRVCIDGVEVSGPSTMVPPHKRKLSMVFQDLALWPHMTVGEHLEFVIRKDGMTKSSVKEEIGRILQNVCLADFQGRYPHQLSGGEKQRLAIGRALASSPLYLLMDEPFSHLDQRLKEELQQLLLNLSQQAKIGTIYVTHNTHEALTVAKRVALMNHGLPIRIDDTEDLLKQEANGFIQSTTRIE
jgi:ABC-type Fe3+/spermidine/putrescine transport system ATPase subunit